MDETNCCLSKRSKKAKPNFSAKNINNEGPRGGFFDAGRDVLSQSSSGRVAGCDFSFIFRNACCERLDVPGKVRLALSRHFKSALAAR